MPEYVAFWGCYIPARMPNIEAASRKVFEVLGVSIEELEGASCCPEPVISKLVARKLWTALAARNIALAEAKGKDIMTLCNGCYETLFEVNHMLKEDAELRNEVNQVLSGIGKKVEGKIEVKHVVEVLGEDIGIEKLKEYVKKPLRGLNVAVHYGCHLFRSAKPDDEDVWKKPRLLEELIRVTEANLVEYGVERLCCGYPARQANVEFSLKNRLHVKLKNMRESNADCIVLACPACYIQFELGQTELRRYVKETFRIPVLHIMELLALSFGISPDEIGIKLHRIPVKNVLEKVKI